MDALRKELAAVWRKAGRMLDAGIPLLKAIRTIAKETASDTVRDALDDIAAAVEKGDTFHEGLGRHPGLFPPSVRTLVHAGEMSGRLEKAAMAVADGLDDGSFSLEAEGPGPVRPEVETPEDARAGDFVTRLIRHAIDSRASDIHLSMAGDKPRVRIRVDGALTEKDVPAVKTDLYPGVLARIKTMAGMSVADRQRPQDGRILVSEGDRRLDLRVNVTPCTAGESMVLRILPLGVRITPLAEQGFSPDELVRLREWIAKPNGLVVVTGPTGSGKTTTLYALLQEVCKPGVKVMSVEDPVECAIDGVDQVQIRVSAGLSFAAALRSVLRQDPDIVMVGEIRDLETAQVAVQTALTGHLVLTTLHTNDAPGAITRLIDVGLSPYLVNGTLVGVLAQRLVRKVCLRCREPYTPDPAVLEVVRRQLPHLRAFTRGRGCDECRHTGYRGRTAVHEFVELNGELRAVVSRNPSSADLYAHAVKGGMRTLQQDALSKAEEGTTTVEEALRVCG